MRTHLIVIAALTLLSSSLFAQADRSKAPELGEIRPLQLPEIQEAQLSNGLKIVYMPKREVPLVQLRMVFTGGRSVDPDGKTGLASLTSDMMTEGAGDRNALDLAEEIDFLGINIQSYASSEYSSVNLLTPVSRMDEALSVYSDVILRPSFDEEELERKRQQLLVGLTQAYDNPNLIASLAFNKLVYGEDHPLSKYSGEQEIKSFSSDDLKSFHETYFKPANGILFVVGDIDLDLAVSKLESAFGSWTGGNKAALPDMKSVKPKKTTVYLIDKPESAQSVINIGHSGPERLTKDYYDITVMNTILGGSFTSRLNSNLREDKGYSYGAYSFFNYGTHTGWFKAGAAVQSDATDKSLVEFMKELKGISKISEDDMNRARNYVALGYPNDFSSVESIAGNLVEAYFYGLPGDYFNTYVNEILGVKRKSALKAAKKYIDTNKMVIVVVGDASKVKAGIDALKLGEVVVMQREDILGPKPEL